MAKWLPDHAGDAQARRLEPSVRDGRAEPAPHGGGERVSGKAGRDAEHRIPGVGLVSLHAEEPPAPTTHRPKPCGFTGTAPRSCGAQAVQAPPAPKLDPIRRVLPDRRDSSLVSTRPAILISRRPLYERPMFGGSLPFVCNLNNSFSGAEPCVPITFAQFTPPDCLR
jgi:hypothetical protein